VSDTHFRHKNIVKFCNRPQGHDRQMQQNWHEVVQPEDTVLHLGDVLVWYGPDRVAAEAIIRSLPGKKYLIRGNHDKEKDSYYENLGFQIIPEFIQEIDGKRVLFSHYPDSTRLSEWDINIHGHIHNSGYDPKYTRELDYRNVSMEVMDYKPVKLGDILDGHYEAIVDAPVNTHELDKTKTT
jgi:calcineurin-like phosphoesterase family protein